MRSIYIIRCILILVLFSACGDSEYEFSNIRSYFIFDNSKHNNLTLASALVPLSPGTFCRIYTQPNNKFAFVNNHGDSSSSVANAVDLQRTCKLGLYNESGIIVGFGNLNMPPTLYAYDAQCPNCYASDGLFRHILSMNSAGIASCPHCHRTYDMNNGGIISGDSEKGDKKLIRYRVSYNEQMRVLSVNN